MINLLILGKVFFFSFESVFMKYMLFFCLIISMSSCLTIEVLNDVQSPGHSGPVVSNKDTTSNEDCDTQVVSTSVDPDAFKKHYVKYHKLAFEKTDSKVLGDYNFVAIKNNGVNYYMFENGGMDGMFGVNRSIDTFVNIVHLDVQLDKSLNSVPVVACSLDYLRLKNNNSKVSTPTRTATGGCIWKMWYNTKENGDKEIVSTTYDFDLINMVEYKRAYPFAAATHFSGMKHDKEIVPEVVYFLSNSDTDMQKLNAYLNRFDDMQIGFEEADYKLLYSNALKKKIAVLIKMDIYEDADERGKIKDTLMY